MREGAFARMPGQLLVAALLIASGRCESQEPGDAASSGAAQGPCPSVVLLRCSQPPPEAVQAGSPSGSRRTTRQRLDSRRLRQMQAEAGLDAIEITAERPQKFEPEPWENFRQSMSGAAVPSCFGPTALSHQGFSAEGLLALPFLVQAAVVGKCR